MRDNLKRSAYFGFGGVIKFTTIVAETKSMSDIKNEIQFVVFLIVK